MKKTLKTLFLSGISMLLCVSMLMGSTFAWFTDEVKSGNNVILAGNLDVEMYWSKDLTKNTWINAEDTNAEPVFNYDKWEPGYAEVRYVKIKNAGNLAFKYALSIIPDGEVSALADVLDVYYVENATANIASRAALKEMTPNGTLRDAINGKIPVNGVILPEGKTAEKGEYVGETIIAIAIKMREEAGNEYKNLSIDSFSLKLSATQYDYENDSFGNDYDEGLTFPGIENFDVVIEAANDNGVVTADTTINGDNYSVTVLSGTKTVNGTLGLSVSEMENSQANVILGENEEMKSLDVHVEGLAEDNDVPVIINLGEVMPKGLNIGNYTLYHVENGTKVAMTPVASVDALAAHNDFYYDPTTGFVTVAMASFSEVALVADTVNAWEGKFDYSWYDASKTELTIANADQLAAFGAIVGGMNGQTRDSFAGKTVKLIADINLGDAEAKNNPNLIFYPIGYNSDDGKYEKTGVAINSSLKTFEGTFDGNGNTIANFYHNTWEMKGDNNYYDATLQYYRDGMGLFGRVYGGTIKNLTVKNFSSDGEYTTTGVIAAYADGATFENIAIFNCNPRVYNIGNGGIVGCVGWYAKDANLKTTFKNITVDNSNKISALWGSYDVACGGIVGQYYPTSGQTSAGTPANGGISFDNCHVSAIMDVYNDVCANYQYYAYRYTGMLIGSVRENVTIDGHVYPKMDGITAKDCTVHFGTWNDYYYCEIIDNTTASYTHDYQMSRLTEIKAIDGTTITYLDDTTGTVPASGRANYVIVDYSKGHGTENATCYHFKDGAVWTHDMGGIQTGIDENGDGQDDLKEDKQHIYLEFNNLVTGYGWGVTTKGVGDLAGVKILDRAEGNSVVKFKGKLNALTTNRVYTLDEIFSYIDGCGVKVVDGAVSVTITNLDENGNVIATFTRGEKWNEGTIFFENTGNIAITIQDYYFCNATTINASVTGRVAEEKFDVVMNNGNFLHRVGNVGTVALDKLFKAKDGVKVGTVSVTVEAVNGTSASGTYSNNAIQFSGTGVVKVTIKDDDKYCTPTVLLLEVVDATNVTGLSDTLSGNVVLLNDCGISSLTVSGRNTVYGNGFTATYSGDGRYLNNGLKQGVITVSENGMLDNLRVVASIYPYMAFSYSDVQKTAPKEVDGTKTRYYYQLSAISASGNATITNCYVYGGRTNIFIGGGDVTIKDTILECGVAANAQIISSNEYTVTLENVTTIQKHVSPTVGDDTEKQTYKMFGAGILLGELDKEQTYTSPKIILNGEFKQYNWATTNDANNINHYYSGYSQTLISQALNQAAFKRSINGNDTVNMGIVFLNSKDPNIVNNTGLNYVGPTEISITTLKGNVYSLSSEAPESQVYSDHTNADRTTVNGLYIPQFKYPADLGGQLVEDNGGDEFLYREGDTIKVLFPSGDSKEIDLTALVNIVKYTGQNLGLVITCKDSNGNAVPVTDGKIVLSDADEYTVTYTVTDTLFFDKDGNQVSNTENYSWNVTMDVSLKDTAISNAYFEFDSSVQKIFRSGNSNIVQFIPFLSGLKIYDYDANGIEYLRFDGGDTSKTTDYNKIAKATIENKKESEAEGNHIVTIEFVDGGKLIIDLDVRADSGSGNHNGSIKVRNNVIYVVNKGTTSGKGQTWKVYSYKFVGNNGTEINSGPITFGTAGTDCAIATKPSSDFSTSVKYTVTFDSNGGECTQSFAYATSAATAVTLPAARSSGKVFNGWYTSANGGTRVGGAGDSYTPSANATLYAQWTEPFTVTYNANGGVIEKQSELFIGKALNLPTPTREGYKFLGWFDAAERGNKVGDAGSDYVPTKEITLYAHWYEISKIYTVTYNANGGSCGTASATYEGTALTLPTPTRTGYTFNGWYTAATGGTKVETPYIPSANITLYAQWTINSYTITVTTSNATVKVNDTTVNNNGTVSIQYGAQVTVEVTYIEKDNRSTTIKGTDGTDYTSPFTMPAQNVTISATSSSGCVTPDTLITLADGTQKRIDEVTYEDKLLVWDFFNGKYTVVPSALIVNHGYGDQTIIKLTFEDGTVVKAITAHSFFDADTNKWELINAENASNYIGHAFVQANGNGYTTTKLVSVEVYEEYTESYSLVSAYHYNFITENMFSLTNSVHNMLAGLVVGEDMTYDEEILASELAEYGQYTYADFEDYITYEQYVAFNGDYLKISVEKGYITFEEILALIREYL